MPCQAAVSRQREKASADENPSFSCVSPYRHIGGYADCLQLAVTAVSRCRPNGRTRLNVCGSVPMCSESAAVSRDLPIPGSPETSTARPSEAFYKLAEFW